MTLPITFSETGALPTGVSLAADGTLSGTPALGTAGIYPITITATDANANTSTQSFTLTVTAVGAVFTSAASTTFAENTAGTFTVTADGRHPDQLHRDRQALPSGVTLGADGTLAGTPAFGSAGTYPITITATDANANSSTQSFTLTVTATRPRRSPRPRRRRFAENTAGTFSVTANGDTPISFTESGALPTGVSLPANGTLAGTPGLGHRGELPDHHHGDRRQREHVDPVLHLDGDGVGADVHLGCVNDVRREHAGTFTVTATGDTPISFTETGSLPSGVTLGSQRHPGRHAGLRDRRQLPGHHHGDRRQRQHGDPVLHPRR